MVASAVNATGCVLWKVSPDSKLDQDPPIGSLFVVAHWCEKNQIFTTFDVPIIPLIGVAILKNQTINVKDAMSEGLESFARSGNVRSLCLVPMNFADATKGIIGMFRDVPQPFDKAAVLEAEQLAQLVGHLHQVIRREVAFRLMQNVDHAVRETERRCSTASLPKDDLKKVPQRICDLVTETLQCVETSIFLEDRFDTPGVYELMATTWPERLKKETYRKGENGLTGYVLNHARPIQIFDLSQDINTIQFRHPGLIWKDSTIVAEAARRFLGIGAGDNLPPLSFIATPILQGEELLGVIRCSLAKGPPYYLGSEETSLLELVAAHISEYWGAVLRRRKSEEENLAWRALIDSIRKLNRFVHNQLAKEVPDEHEIFAQALQVTDDVIRGAEITDIRLLDQNKKELYFAETHGVAWNTGSKGEIQERLRRRFSVLENPPKSVGADVYKTRTTCVIPDVHDTSYHYSETFPDTKRIIVAPIGVEDKFFGVLDIRGTGEHGFAPHTEAIADVLGQQLGLYHYLMATISQLRSSEAEREIEMDHQRQTFEDLEHQLKSPIIQAYARVQAFLKDIPAESRVLRQMQAIRGLCGKVRRVTISTGIFASLAKGKPIEPTFRSLYYQDLIRMLIEAAMDHEFIVDTERYIKFEVIRKTFEPLGKLEVRADPDLLEQAVNNVLDNAGKYSFPSTSVLIYGGFTGKGRFHISVANKGIKIHSREVRQCSERGWRGEEAAAASGDGTGIGLWIVDNVMKSQGGELIIAPTTSDGITEIKLILPVSS